MHSEDKSVLFRVLVVALIAGAIWFCTRASAPAPDQKPTPLIVPPWVPVNPDNPWLPRPAPAPKKPC